MASRAAVFILAAAGTFGAFGPSSCRRGCLSTYLRDHVAGAPPSPTSPDAIRLAGVDCPDGLARCTGGVVQASRSFRYALPCKGPPESCSCPWETVEDCAHGCAADGAEIVVERDRAAARLCAPDPLRPIARPALGVAPPPGVCADDGYRCVGALVVACRDDGSSFDARVVAACTSGCFKEGDDIDAPDDESATRILCARASR